MWSVVEKTALAEAEVEYEDFESDQVWVKFPIIGLPEENNLSNISQMLDASIVIWTTTPWTIPGNRAICFSERIAYALYQVTSAPIENWVGEGEKLVMAVSLADSFFDQARVDGFKRIDDVSTTLLKDTICAPPLRPLCYHF